MKTQTAEPRKFKIVNAYRTQKDNVIVVRRIAKKTLSGRLGVRGSLEVIDVNNGKEHKE